MALKVLYTIFLGLLVALFVGIGVAAFYTAPKMPDRSRELDEPYAAPIVKDGSYSLPTETPEQKAKRLEYQEASDKYNKEILPRYNRNVSIISMAAAILVLIISLVFVPKIQLISDGLLLGGVLTLLYSLIRGLMGEDNIYRFLVVCVGLAVALILGYVKFIRQDNKK